MKKSLLYLLILLPLAFAGGFLLDQFLDTSPASTAPAVPVFHDMRVNPIDEYLRLIDPDHPDIVALAKKFGQSYDAAYQFVSREITFVPYAPPGPVEKSLEYRTGSCLGKAALLTSIYRAMGMPSENVRLVMGMIVTPQGLAEHAWLDLEHRGQCLQQDPSGMLGQFRYDEFPGNRYVETYVMKENFCFNDCDFAVVSQLNQFRNGSGLVSR